MISGEAVTQRLGGVSGDRAILQPQWLLLALTPVIMALVTWGPQQHHYAAQMWLRFFSLPTLIIESIVIGIALAKGVRPLGIVRSLPLSAQAALAIIVAIDLGTAMFVALDPGSAILRANTTLIHICFGLSAAGLVGQASAQFDRDIWRLIVGGLLLYAMLLVIFVALIADPVHFDWDHLGLAVSNIRHLGFFLLVGASASLALALLTEHSLAYWGWVLAATIFTGLMFWSGSRNPVLALSMAGVIGATTVPAMRTWKAAMGWAVSMIGGAAISLVHVPPHPAFGLYRMFFSVSLEDADAVSSGRLEIWTGALQAFTERPIFGFGEAQFIKVVPEALSIYHHPHNLVLQFLVQWGAVGALCAMALLIWAWWRIAHLARVSADKMLPAFLVLTALGAASFFDGIFFFVYPGMVVTLTIALALGTLLRSDAIPGAGHPPA